MTPKGIIETVFVLILVGLLLRNSDNASKTIFALGGVSSGLMGVLQLRDVKGMGVEISG